MDTSRMRLVTTRHAERTIAEKGFDMGRVTKTFRNPDYVTNVAKYPDQIRLIGNGLALVGMDKGDTFVLITVYLDGVITPPRPDQLNTPEGRRYAERYAQGLGRG